MGATIAHLTGWDTRTSHTEEVCGSDNGNHAHASIGIVATKHEHLHSRKLIKQLPHFQPINRVDSIFSKVFSSLPRRPGETTNGMK